MASSARQVIFFLLITVVLLSASSTHARDSQFFSKTPASTTTNTNDVVPNTIQPKEKPEKTKNQLDQGEPNFLPQNEEESYGLYGHETGQLPPSSKKTTTDNQNQPLHKYLPKNYNPVAYVTVPENTNEDADVRSSSYYSGQLRKEDEDFTEYRSSNRLEGYSEDLNKESYYKLGSDFNGPREARPATATFRKSNADEGFQGMSDTRFLENGRYHYDVNSEKFSRNHPYETLNNENDEFKGENYYYKPVGEFNSQDGGNKLRYEEGNNMP